MHNGLDVAMIILWSLQAPDLTTCDNSLGATVKAKNPQLHPTTAKAYKQLSWMVLMTYSHIPRKWHQRKKVGKVAWYRKYRETQITSCLPHIGVFWLPCKSKTKPFSHYGEFSCPTPSTVSGESKLQREVPFWSLSYFYPEKLCFNFFLPWFKLIPLQSFFSIYSMCQLGGSLLLGRGH